MRNYVHTLLGALTFFSFAIGLACAPDRAVAADRLIGLHSAQVMSQSMPWIAQEAGLFKKYDLDFRLVFIPSSPVATAATLNGDAEIGVTGAVGNVRAYVQGFTDLVFIAGMKNILTHSVLGKPDIKRPEDLKGKKVGVGRFGGNTHYFVIQALKRLGMDAAKDIQTIQTGGGPETLAALLSGSLDAAGLVAPGDSAAVAKGFRYVINGPEMRIPYGATQVVTLRSMINKRGPVIFTRTENLFTRCSANTCALPTPRCSMRPINPRFLRSSGDWKLPTRRCKRPWMRSRRKIRAPRRSSRPT
jgi:ABC-type nitrate/sulfonate/bicarbonate transport system substrate-binding protein